MKYKKSPYHIAHLPYNLISLGFFLILMGGVGAGYFSIHTKIIYCGTTIFLNVKTDVFMASYAVDIKF